MDINNIKANFVKYQESIKTQGLIWISNSLRKSEYLDYSEVDLYEAIKNEQTECIRSVLMLILYLKVEEKSKQKVDKMSLIHSKKR